MCATSSLSSVAIVIVWKREAYSEAAGGSFEMCIEYLAAQKAHRGLSSCHCRHEKRL